jgi:ribA/ribD-fused uncharacterized protein
MSLPSNGNESDRVVEVAPGQDFFLFKNGYCPLSNCSFSPFVENKTRYRSVQQYLYAQKALAFRDFIAYQGIMDEKSARKCRDYRIRGYQHDRWIDQASNHLRTALQLKFAQCSAAREKLMSTGQASIVYATEYDRVLGSGLDFLDERNLDPAHWQGINELGLLLVEQRGLLEEPQGEQQLDA